MSSSATKTTKVVSGMRTTGSLHLGHYHGVLKNWLKLQHEYDCFFFAADLHALTTHYAERVDFEKNIMNMIIDWLAVGVNPNACTIFVQSEVPEHAELHLLLSMVTPLSWLERVPTFKDQQEKLKDKDLSTYGFLGYPLLQSADILLYKPKYVPVGEDQVTHIELTREVARRFNHLFGKEEGFVEKAELAISKMGKKNARLYRSLLKNYQETGLTEALTQGLALVKEQSNLSMGDIKRLEGFLEGTGKVILPEPEALLTPESKMPGLDGQKMSKSYSNVIGLRESKESVEKKIFTMQTDPKRIRRDDPGTPEKCPVWELHKVYSNEDTKKWVQQGCTSAGIGCVDCKRAVCEKIIKEQEPIIAKGLELEANPRMVKEVLRDGCARAREVAKETLAEVSDAIGLIR